MKNGVEILGREIGKAEGILAKGEIKEKVEERGKVGKKWKIGRKRRGRRVSECEVKKRGLI